MKKNAKQTILISSLFVASIGLIVAGPVSRIVYSIWDKARTDQIINEMIEKENGSSGEVEEKEVNRKAYFNSENNGYKYDLLVLLDEENFELTHYERNETSSLVYYHTQGAYTFENNIVSIVDVTKCVSNLYNNPNFATGNDAESRKTLYDGIYSSTSFALQSNGTFVVGGASDTNDEIPSLGEVYSLYDSSSRPTYKTLVLFSDDTYVATSFSLNSKNNEEASGSFAARGTYSVKEKDVVSLEDYPEEKYDVLTINPGYGYSWASNNGSLMGFDCIAEANFNQWWMMNLSGTSTAETRVSKTGYSYTVGAKKESYGKYSLSFVDAGKEETPDTPVENDYPVRAEVASSDLSKPFILEFNEDMTLSTGWTNYAQTVKEATYKMDGDNLVINAGETGYTFTCTFDADGSLKVVVNYGQMGEKEFSFNAKQASLIKAAGTVNTLAKAEVASSIEGKPFVLEFKEDGSVVTGWTNYAQTIKTLSWEVKDGAISVDVGESGYEVTVVEDSDGSAIVSVNYGQMGTKEFVLSSELVSAIKGETNVVLVHSEVASSAEGKPFILDIYSDGTISTGWTNYEQTVKTLNWKMDKGSLSIDVGSSGYSVSIANGENGEKVISINYGQMGTKEYTISAEDYAKITATVKTLVHTEVASSVENKPFILEFNDDYSITSGWTNYAQTVKTLAWSIEKDNLVIDPLASGYATTVEPQADGTIKVSINYGQMGAKEYTLSVEEVASLKATVGTILKAEVASSVEGKPFVFEVKEDGSLVTGWTYYAQTVKTISWEMKNGEFTVDVGSSGYTVSIADGENGAKNITVNYGQMGDKTFNLSADDYAKITSTVKTLVKAEVASSVENKPFVLEIKDDGSFVTGWTNYAQTVKTLSWSVNDGNIAVDVGTSGYTVTITDGEDGAKVISINYDQMGTKEYTISASDYAKLVA